MSTLRERLKSALDGPPKTSQADLAKACGVKPPSVSDWLSGRTKNIEGSNLLAAARLLRVNPEWLATGKGPRDVSPAQSQSLSPDITKMRAAAEFLEELFHQRDKVFVASEQINLLMAVYSELVELDSPNLVAMTLKYGPMIGGDDGEREREAGSAGTDGRRRAGRSSR